MAFKLITLDVADKVAVLTLNQPDSRNGMSAAIQIEMLEALAQIRHRDDVGAMILTGAGKAFCSGADLTPLNDAMRRGESAGELVGDDMEHYSNPLILALQRMPIPVVAAVNGAAAGAGVSLALVADIVVAGRSAFFLSPFLPRLGIVPDMGSTWFLPQQIGRTRSLGLMLLGDRLGAQQAVEWGMIWACVDDAALMTEARSIASRLARSPIGSVLEARRALDHAREHDLEAQLSYETVRQRHLLDQPAFAEGVAAFLEKREPRFHR